MEGRTNNPEVIKKKVFEFERPCLLFYMTKSTKKLKKQFKEAVRKIYLEDQLFTAIVDKEEIRQEYADLLKLQDKEKN